MKREQFLPAITTTRGSDWRAKVREIDELGLKQVAFFPTCLKKEEREEFYKLIERTRTEAIPFVHLRNDMELWELDYLVKKYRTEIFNTHSPREHRYLCNWSKYQKIIFLENSGHFFDEGSFDEKELQEFPGICLDFAHLEDDKRLYPRDFARAKIILEKYPIGCNHISVVTELPHQGEDGNWLHNIHYLDDLSQLDYLKSYPLRYFSRICAIELENSLKEQLQAIDYILGLC